jgi:hypothetical protein
LRCRQQKRHLLTDLTSVVVLYAYERRCAALRLDFDRATWEAPGINHYIWLTQFLYRDALW